MTPQLSETSTYSWSSTSVTSPQSLITLQYPSSNVSKTSSTATLLATYKTTVSTHLAVRSNITSNFPVGYDEVKKKSLLQRTFTIQKNEETKNFQTLLRTATEKAIAVTATLQTSPRTRLFELYLGNERLTKETKFQNQTPSGTLNTSGLDSKPETTLQSTTKATLSTSTRTNKPKPIIVPVLTNRHDVISETKEHRINMSSQDKGKKIANKPYEANKEVFPVEVILDKKRIRDWQTFGVTTALPSVTSKIDKNWHRHKNSDHNRWVFKNKIESKSLLKVEKNNVNQWFATKTPNQNWYSQSHSTQPHSVTAKAYEVEVEPMTVSYFDPHTLKPQTTTSSSRHNQHHSHHHHHYDISSAVVVTALFDIGRGEWYKYTRSYKQYLQYLQKLLLIRNRLVIYTDSEGAKYVRKKRHLANTEAEVYLESKKDLQVYEMSIQQLPLYRYRKEMKEIIDYEQKNWSFDEAMKDHPESKSVDYDLVVNSKAFFVYNATKSSKFRFNAKYFAWIDAGYGHSDQSVIPPHCLWKPALPYGFITVIKITPEYDKVERYTIKDLYRIDWSVISGGFFGGDIETIDKFYRFYYKTFLDLLDERKVDDDQTTLTVMMKNYPNLFYTLHSNGEWFALFQFFPC